MRNSLKCIPFIFIFLFLIGCQEKTGQVFEPPVIEVPESIADISQYLTRANRSAMFDAQASFIFAPDESLSNTINVNLGTTFQQIDGFGFALTGGSAKHISQMSPSAKEALLQELFNVGDDQIGMSFIRISVGASDLDEAVFSYNDLPSGQTDINQDKFSISRDQERLIPLLKEIIAINPDIKIMASPWSPPAWMKNNSSPKGGSLLFDYYDSYATYLLKYIQEMAKEGITISHLSIQNEPLHDGNNPSMFMNSGQQKEFIKGSLGPLFQENNIATKILIYDHNPDRIDYPLDVLDDPIAKQYVDGSAFHLYAGSITALSTVRNSHPDKNIYFTEQWFGAPGNFSEDLKWHTREVIIGSTRNWSRNVIEWNLSSNPDLSPHTDGGCDRCLGGITINGDNVTRNAGYYVIAHVSKYVRPESTRIGTNYIDALPNVAFVTSDQKIVLLVLNNTDSVQKFNVKQDSVSFSSQLDAGSVSTYIWNLK